MTKKICWQCGKSISSRPSLEAIPYCSDECRLKAFMIVQDKDNVVLEDDDEPLVVEPVRAPASVYNPPVVVHKPKVCVCRWCGADFMGSFNRSRIYCQSCIRVLERGTGYRVARHGNF